METEDDTAIESNAITMLAYGGATNLEECIKTLKSRAENIHCNDTAEIETLLSSQAMALNSIFVDLALRGSPKVNNSIHAQEKLLRLALKAQSQCRTTLETLSEIKNPKPYIQHNQAQYQQVNNRKPSRARKNKKQNNELLEDNRDEQQWLDTGTPQETSRSHKEMEALEQ